MSAPRHHFFAPGVITGGSARTGRHRPRPTAGLLLTVATLLLALAGAAVLLLWKVVL